MHVKMCVMSITVYGIATFVSRLHLHDVTDSENKEKATKIKESIAERNIRNNCNKHGVNFRQPCSEYHVYQYDVALGYLFIKS